MMFNTITFAIFLVSVFAAYWLLHKSREWQNVLLLIVSYVFYGWWDWRYLSLIFGCTAVNYVGSLLIAHSNRRFRRKCILVACCFASLGTLFYFKYFNFFLDSLNHILALVPTLVPRAPFSAVNILLPVGISFFTFQSLSYTFDVYFGKVKPTRNWVEFFAFVSFFPQLVAGPIERAGSLLPQFEKPRKFDFDKATHGLCLIAYGLFKKMVVADTLAIYVDSAFSMPMSYSTTVLVLAAVFFSLQIYCDFSGYSDIARGSAKLFGFELMLNFDRPYLARTYSDFWRRWHISLSTWFKDYVYIPLGGNRVSFLRAIFNLWVVFLLSGLWHGASWAFVVWGAIHAVFLTFGAMKKKFLGRIFESSLFVYVGVVFAWIFFRAGTIVQAVNYFRAMARFRFYNGFSSLLAGVGGIDFCFLILVSALLVVSYACPRDCAFRSMKSKMLFIAACAFAIVFLGMPSEGEFIYFRF